MQNLLCRFMATVALYTYIYFGGGNWIDILLMRDTEVVAVGLLESYFWGGVCLMVSRLERWGVVVVGFGFWKEVVGRIWKQNCCIILQFGSPWPLGFIVYLCWTCV